MSRTNKPSQFQAASIMPLHIAIRKTVGDTTREKLRFKNITSYFRKLATADSIARV